MTPEEKCGICKQFYNCTDSQRQTMELCELQVDLPSELIAGLVCAAEKTKTMVWKNARTEPPEELEHCSVDCLFMNEEQECFGYKCLSSDDDPVPTWYDYITRSNIIGVRMYCVVEYPGALSNLKGEPK